MTKLRIRVCALTALMSAGHVVHGQCVPTVLHPVEHLSDAKIFASAGSDPDGPGPRAGVVYSLAQYRFPSNNTFRWVMFDGNRWEPIPDPVYSSEFSSFGPFTTATGNSGGFMTNNLWYWNGQSWSRRNQLADGTVLATGPVTTHQDHVYCWTTTPTLGWGIYRLNDTRWEMHAPAQRAGGTIWAPPARSQITSAGTEGIIVIDNFASINGVNSPGIMRWNGSTWVGLGGGIGNKPYNMSVVGTDVYVSGQALILNPFLPLPTQAGTLARWDGTAWSPVAVPAAATGGAGFVNTVAWFNGELHAEGTFGHAIRRNNAWVIVPTTYTSLQPTTQSLGGFVPFGNSLYRFSADVNSGAAGTVIQFSVADVWRDGVDQPVRDTQNPDRIRFQGGRWIANGRTGLNNSLPAILEFREGEWQVVQNPAPSDSGFAVGPRFVRTPGNGTIELLVGDTWTSLGSPGGFSSVAWVQNELVAVGAYTAPTTNERYPLKRWDGVAWVPFLGTVRSGGTTLVAIEYNGEVYIGGFLLANVPDNGFGLLRWNGTTWARVGVGVNAGSTVSKLLIDSSNNLWISGIISVNGQPNSGAMARWDGTTLTGFGTGWTRDPALFEFEGDVYSSETALGRFRNGQYTMTSPYASTFSTLNFGVGDRYENELRGFAAANNGTVQGITRVVFDGRARIERQPRSTTIACGQSTTLSIGATQGYPGLRFQWKRNGEILTDTTNASGTIIEGATRSILRLYGASANLAGAYTCDLISPCETVTSQVATLSVTGCAVCDSIDFNNNTVFPEDQDVIDFFSVLAGGPCSNDPNCNDIDFNNNTVFPEDQDVIDFFTVLAGGTCL